MTSAFVLLLPLLLYSTLAGGKFVPHGPPEDRARGASPPAFDGAGPFLTRAVLDGVLVAMPREKTGCEEPLCEVRLTFFGRLTSTRSCLCDFSPSNCRSRRSTAPVPDGAPPTFDHYLPRQDGAPVGKAAPEVHELYNAHILSGQYVHKARAQETHQRSHTGRAHWPLVIFSPGFMVGYDR